MSQSIWYTTKLAGCPETNDGKSYLMMLEVCIKRRDQADTALDDAKGTKGARDTNEVGLN